jgi:hypothetical protein
MGWISSEAIGFTTSKKYRKTRVNTVRVSGTTYYLYEYETVKTFEFRGLTYGYANTGFVGSSKYNFDTMVYTDWVTGAITNRDAKRNGSKGSASYFRANKAGGYTVTYVVATISSTTAQT